MQKAVFSVIFFFPVLIALFCSLPTDPVRVVRVPAGAPAGMKLIVGGTFSMGSPDTMIDKGAQPPHFVTVSSFYMDSTETTQKAYVDLLGIQYNPTFWANATSPIEHITWFDAVLFANARSKIEHYDSVYTYTTALTKTIRDSLGIIRAVRCTSLVNLKIDYAKKGYRLPTEAEWEYACRAGTTTVDYWGSDQDANLVDKNAWFSYNSSRQTHSVAKKSPNAWGLYDMIGNVSEWCNDWHVKGYSPEPVTNPTGLQDSGTTRVVRGGSAVGNNTAGSLARSGTRVGIPPTSFDAYTGFRLVIQK